MVDSEKLNNLWKIVDDFFVYYDVEFNLLSSELFRIMQFDYLDIGKNIVVRHLNKIRARLHEANFVLMEIATCHGVTLPLLSIPAVVNNFEMEAFTTALAKLDRACENLYNNQIYLKGEIKL